MVPGTPCPGARSCLGTPPCRQLGRQRVPNTADWCRRPRLRDGRLLREVVEAAAQVAPAGRPGAQDACPAQGLEAARRAEPPFEVLVIPRDALLDRLARLVQRTREDGGQRRGIGGRAVGRHLGRHHPGRRDRPAEDERGVGTGALLAHVDVDDLSPGVDGAVDVGLRARDRDVRLVHAPPLQRSPTA